MLVYLITVITCIVSLATYLTPSHPHTLTPSHSHSKSLPWSVSETDKPAAQAWVPAPHEEGWQGGPLHLRHQRGYTHTHTHTKKLTQPFLYIWRACTRTLRTTVPMLSTYSKSVTSVHIIDVWSAYLASFVLALGMCTYTGIAATWIPYSGIFSPGSCWTSPTNLR